MATFPFTGASVNSTNVSGNTTLAFIDQGVNFTWSIQNGDGNDALGANRAGILSASHGPGPNEIFILVVTGPGTSQTQFSGVTGSPISIAFTSLSGSWNVTFVKAGQTTTMAVSTGTGFTLTAVGQFDFIRFTPSSAAGSFFVDTLFATINCFLEGTRMAGAVSDIAVEDLQLGDQLRLADGGTTTVKWVVKQRMFLRFQKPADINPICIKGGALADGVPARNLYVTQDHALILDGMLINAGALVNGTTIYQVAKMPLDGFSYYHVETDAHEAILAEGTAVESFVDFAGRTEFDNGAGHPTRDVAIAEMDMPRVATRRMLPTDLRKRLDDRVSEQAAA
jgi:hypothetical protein